MKVRGQAVTLLLSACLTLPVSSKAFAYQDAPSSASLPTPDAQQSAEQLQQMVAPIALYPDTLVAQILAAATYPAQVVEAQRWMSQNSALPGPELAQQVDQQTWDPSVKALTQFPAVLANMDKNLAWTSALGDAYVNQQKEMMNAVQTLRQRAQHAGNLDSTSQQTVTNQGKTIEIQPVNQEIVYVPEYDPWLAFGDPIGIWPGWYPYPGLYLGGPGIAFGIGYPIGWFAPFGWGWHHWRADWHGRRVFFDRNPYTSRTPTFINRNDFHHGRGGFNGAGGFHNAPPPRQGTRSGAFTGFDHGGVAHGYSSRGQSSFGVHGGLGGGSHGGGGFHGGGSRGGGHR